MKNFISILSSTVLAGVLSLGTLASMPSASAQAVAKADIPFAFHVGNTLMPPGTYKLTRNSNFTYILRGPGSSAAFVVMRAESSIKDRGSVITFNRYGDRYFLSQVWDGHDGLECSPSRAEKEANKASLVASTKQTSSGTIAVALNNTPQR